MGKIIVAISVDIPCKENGHSCMLSTIFWIFIRVSNVLALSLDVLLTTAFNEC
jgi:hypothetical protein